MTRVSGTGNGITFTADSDNVEVVLPSGSTSGYVGAPGMFGIHSIECPPLPKYFSLLQDYLFSDQNASVQYLRAGSRRGQSVPEQVWAWGMGMPASKHTTHNEQTGYASMSREQWLGLDSAVGSYFVNPNGVQIQFTSEMAQCMRDQMDGLAADYADWCHRYQFTPHMGDQAEILRGCDGEAVGCAFFHYQASKLPGSTTSHHDPGEGSYPEDVFLAKALAAFSGRTGGSTPATPTIPLTPDAPAPVLVFPPPPPEGLTMDTQVRAAFDALYKKIDANDAALLVVVNHVQMMAGALGIRTQHTDGLEVAEGNRIVHIESMLGAVGEVVNATKTSLTGLASAVVKQATK